MPVLSERPCYLSEGPLPVSGKQPTWLDPFHHWFRRCAAQTRDQPLPPAVNESVTSGHRGRRSVIDQPAERDDAHKPEDAKEDGDTVQVPLYDRRGAERRGDA